jgi:hypothetical protein
MWRQVCLCAVFALMMIPDWATGFGFRRFGVCVRGPVPVQTYCPPRVMLVSPVMPWYQPYPVCPSPVPSPIQPSVTLSNPVTPSQPSVPKVETIPSESASPAKPVEVKPEEKKPTEAPRIEVIPKPPMPGIPSKEKSEPFIPNLKKETTSEPLIPKIPAPIMPEVKGTAPGKGDEVPKIPSLIQPVPGGSGLQPLTVPGESTSKSSPITNRPPVSIYWVEGDAPTLPDELRKVNFFNHTERTVELKVEGKAVKLLKKHFVEVEVSQKFSWRLDDYPVQSTTIPLANPGAEIVIRGSNP